MSSFLLKSDISEIVNRLEPYLSFFTDKTILLTGSRGFLGRYFIEVFNELSLKMDKPLKVIALDNFITAGEAGAEIPNYKHIKFFKHDVIKKFECEEKIDFLIHAAGIASPHYYQAYPLEALDVAITGTRLMLDLAKKNNAKFTFFSSSEIYGDPDAKNIPIKETYRGNVSCQGPRSCYDESKRVGETLCYIYNNSKSTHTNTIRPFNIYGPGMQEKDYRVLPNFARKIKRGEALEVYGSGNQTRTFCYITDAIFGFLLVIIKGLPGEAYNIGNESPEVSVNDLAERLKLISPKPITYKCIDYPDTYPEDEPNRRMPSLEKAKLQLNYQPNIDLNEGLRRFIGWTEDNYSEA